MSSDRRNQMLGMPHGGAEAFGDYQAAMHTTDDQHSTTGNSYFFHFSSFSQYDTKVSSLFASM